MCVWLCRAASANLKGKEKKAHEAKKIEALGGKAAKSRTMPYNILMAIKKKGDQREKQQQELVCCSACVPCCLRIASVRADRETACACVAVQSKAADVVSGKRKASSKANSSNKKKKTIDYGLQVTKGRFKNGVLTVSRSM